MEEGCVTETPLTATVTTGEDRNVALARWEREGKLTSDCILTGRDEHDRRAKVRVVQVWKTLHSDKISVTQEVVKFQYDGRLPYPPDEVFARIALAVMALT